MSRDDHRGETSISGRMRPTEDEMIQAVAQAFDAPEAAAISMLKEFCLWFDARAAAERLAEREGACRG